MELVLDNIKILHLNSKLVEHARNHFSSCKKDADEDGSKVPEVTTLLASPKKDNEETVSDVLVDQLRTKVSGQKFFILWFVNFSEASVTYRSSSNLTKFFNLNSYKIGVI